MLFAIVASLLAGCTTDRSEPVVTTVCPPVKEYSAEFMASAADELATIPEGGAIETMLLDYSALRDQLRTCQ